MIVEALLAIALEKECLAKNIYHEARGESIDGQLAVAEVTLNRVLDPKFPNTVCEVVWDSGQFSWTAKEPKIKNKESWKQVSQLVEEIATNQTELLEIGAVFYHEKSIQPYWSESFTRVGRIGSHVFYAW